MSKEKTKTKKVTAPKSKDSIDPSDVVPESSKDIREPETALAEMEAQWKRALADYQNLTKEMATERVRMRTDAVRDVVLGILPILDNFGAAMRQAPKCHPELATALARSRSSGNSGSTKQIENWVQGVGFIQKQMEDMLTEFGVKRIEAVGKPFDASLMEAVGEEPSAAEASEGKDALESGTVLKETCAGYTLGETTIRPAKVITVK